jgi:hypothetical protein
MQTTVTEFARKWGLCETTARLRLEQKVKEGTARKRVEIRPKQAGCIGAFPSSRITVYTVLEGT